MGVGPLGGWGLPMLPHCPAPACPRRPHPAPARSPWERKAALTARLENGRAPWWLARAPGDATGLHVSPDLGPASTTRVTRDPEHTPGPRLLEAASTFVPTHPPGSALRDRAQTGQGRCGSLEEPRRTSAQNGEEPPARQGDRPSSGSPGRRPAGLASGCPPLGREAPSGQRAAGKPPEDARTRPVPISALSPAPSKDLAGHEHQPASHGAGQTHGAGGRRAEGGVLLSGTITSESSRLPTPALQAPRGPCPVPWPRVSGPGGVPSSPRPCQALWVFLPRAGRGAVCLRADLALRHRPAQTHLGSVGGTSLGWPCGHGGAGR